MKNFFKKKLFKLLYRARQVGVDEFFNQYFLNDKNQRFVIYNGIEEPTKIPMNWHLWIHHISDEIPSDLTSLPKKYSWQKIHLPNLTGTKNAYSPSNCESSMTSQIYHSWQPK